MTAKIDWCSSPDVSMVINGNEIKNLEVGGFKHAKWLMPISIGIIALHFILQAVLGITWVVFLAIPTFLALVYYMTAGSKEYLTLKESLAATQ